VLCKQSLMVRCSCGSRQLRRGQQQPQCGPVWMHHPGQWGVMQPGVHLGDAQRDRAGNVFNVIERNRNQPYKNGQRKIVSRAYCESTQCRANRCKFAVALFFNIPNRPCQVSCTSTLPASWEAGFGLGTAIDGETPFKTLGLHPSAAVPITVTSTVVVC
jgi:hypothetical protein